MWYGSGNQPRTSTQTLVTNPSTSGLLAEISSLHSDNYEARVLLGASTLATFWVEHCLSTGLGSTALRTSTGGSGYLGRRVVFATVNQTAQYMLRFKAEAGDLLRVRVATALTADAAATIQLERLS